MAIETLTTLPAAFFAGDTVKVLLSDASFAAPLWDLVLAFNGPEQFTVAAVDSGESHSVTVATADTANREPGVYAWAAIATSGGERRTIASGNVWIRANPALAVVSKEEEWVALLDAHIEGRLPKGLESHSINGNQIQLIKIADAVALREKFIAKVKALNRNKLHSEEFDPYAIPISFAR